MSLMLICDSDITLSASGAPECLNGWSTQLAVAPFDISQIDPSVAVVFFTFGFVVFLVPMATAFGLTKIINLIR